MCIRDSIETMWRLGTSFSSSGKRMLTRREIEVFSFARSCTLSNLYLVNDLSALWSLPCPHRHFHRYTPWHPQKWSLLFFPGCMHNQWLLPKNRRSWWSSSGPSHSRWNAPGGGRGGHWYMPVSYTHLGNLQNRPHHRKGTGRSQASDLK